MPVPYDRPPDKGMLLKMNFLISKNEFSDFSTKIYVVGTQKNLLDETIF